MQNAVIATLSGTEQCQRTVDALKQAGFTSDDISLLLPDDYGASELGFARQTKLLEGAALGVTIGLVIGLAFAYAAASHYIDIPEVQNLFTSVPAFAALASVALSAGIGGVIGMIIGATMTEYVVRKYERRTMFGSALLSIHVDNMTELQVAEKILKVEGAQDVGILSEDARRRRPVKLAAATS